MIGNLLPKGIEMEMLEISEDESTCSHHRLPPGDYLLKSGNRFWYDCITAGLLLNRLDPHEYLAAAGFDFTVFKGYSACLKTSLLDCLQPL